MVFGLMLNLSESVLWLVMPILLIKKTVAVMFILSTMIKTGVFFLFLTNFKMDTSLVCCPSICILIFNIIIIHVISFKNLKLKKAPLHHTGSAGALERLRGVLR